MLQKIHLDRGEIIVEGDMLTRDDLEQAHTFADNMARLLTIGKYKGYRLENDDDVRPTD